MRAVFQRAKGSPASVILIPDLALMATSHLGAAGDPVDQILSWLLSEMDALEDFGRVVVIGIVSSPEELEPSLRQRFQREIEVGLPDRQGRLEIVGIQARRMPLADDVDLGRLADMTDEYPGVLLWRMCQEAATWALRRSLEHEKITDEEIPQERLEQIKVGMKDFLHALDSVKP